MIKTYKNIDLNKPMDEVLDNAPVVGMKVKEIATGRIAKITGVYPDDNEVWMVSGSDVGVFQLSSYWEIFKKVNL